MSTVRFGDYLDVRTCTPVTIMRDESGNARAVWQDGRGETDAAIIADLISAGILSLTAAPVVCELVSSAPQVVKSCERCEQFMPDDWIGSVCYACDTAQYRATGYHAWEVAPADCSDLAIADVTITKAQHDALIARKTAVIDALANVADALGIDGADIQRFRNAAGAIVTALALFAAVYQAPVDCSLIGETGEGFPLAKCANGDVIYQDMDGAATHAAGAWVVPME